MSGGKVVAWVSKNDPMFRDDWRATTPLVYSDEHDDSALGPMVGLVLQSDLDAAIARAEALEAMNHQQAKNIMQQETARRDAETRAEAAEAKLAWLRGHAKQSTAYDIYGDGAYWSIGFHSDDLRLDFNDAIAAQQAEGV